MDAARFPKSAESSEGDTIAMFFVFYAVSGAGIHRCGARVLSCAWAMRESVFCIPFAKLINNSKIPCRVAAKKKEMRLLAFEYAK